MELNAIEAWNRAHPDPKERKLTAGEPIGNVDGSVATEIRDGKEQLVEWGRDQNDGPAIAAMELNLMAEILAQKGKEKYARQAIRDDLAKTYLEHVSRQGITHAIEYAPGLRGEISAETWEELFGRGHIYTAMMQFRSLIESAQALSRQAIGPNPDATQLANARRYRRLAARIRTEMESHWVVDRNGKIYAGQLLKRAREMRTEARALATKTGDRGATEVAAWLRREADDFIRRANEILMDPNHPEYPADERMYFVATVGPEAGKTFHFERTLPADSLFAIALNHARDGPAIAFRHGDSRALSTIHVLEQQSRRRLGTSAERYGVLPILRYSEDIWQGSPKASQGRTPGKYAWTLVTENMATYHYLLRNELLAEGRIRIDDFNLAFYRSLARQGFPEFGDAAKIRPGVELSAGGPTAPLFAAAIHAIERKADGYLKIVRDAYTAKGGSSEGFDPVTLAARGPENLTWNWSEWFRMIWARADRPVPTKAQSIR